MRIQAWTDQWVRQIKHPDSGEAVYPDPQVSGHRLIVRKTRKIFEVQRDRPRMFGPRKTFKVQTGNALTTTIEEARTDAIVALGEMAKGLDPHPANKQPPVTTLGSAWVEFKKRDDLRPRTLTLYEDTYNRCLKQWESEALATLAANPAMARDHHRALTKARGPRTANMALSLLRTIHRHAAELDTSLSFERHPCTAVRFHDEKPRANAAIPAEGVSAWFQQVEKFRNKSPIRASFHILCLRLGTRPGELAARKWSDVDENRMILTLPETKTHLGGGAFNASVCHGIETCKGGQPRTLSKQRVYFPGARREAPIEVHRAKERARLFR